MNQRMVPWWYPIDPSRRNDPWWIRTFWLRPFGIILPIGTSTRASGNTYGTIGIAFLNILVFAMDREESVRLAMVPTHVRAGGGPIHARDSK